MDSSTDHYLTYSFWDGILQGGPVILLLHYCILICFALSLASTFRRPNSTFGITFAIGPFVFGSTAMWAGIVGFNSVLPEILSEIDPRTVLSAIQRHFLLGSVLSSIALIVHFTFRGFRWRAESAKKGISSP